MAGQVIKRGDGTWLVRIFLGRDAGTGKRRFLNKTVHGRKRDAQELATRILRDRDMDTLVLPSRETVSEYLDKWLDTKVNVRARTLADYRSQIDRHIRPEIGSLRLSQLSRPLIQKLCNDLSARGKSPRTVKYVYDVLRMALTFAVRTGLLVRNPSDLVSIPKQIRGRSQSLNSQQTAIFIRAAREDRWAALWLLLVTAGLRPGEALALRWTDIDMANMELRVQQVLTRLDHHGWSFQEPKTHQSRRTVAVLPSVVKSLVRHRKVQAAERLKAGDQYRSHDLVFANRLGDPLDYRVVVRRHFRPLLKATGLPAIRPYDLRHTAATLAMGLGTPVKVVSEQLGHSNSKMTLDTYQHVLPHMQREAATKLETLLFPTRRQSEA